MPSPRPSPAPWEREGPAEREGEGASPVLGLEGEHTPIAINSFAGAAAAYTCAHDRLAGAGVGEEPLPAASTGRSSFADMVKSAIDGAVATGRESERLSLAAVGDGADVSQVVTAVAEAETVLNTVMAVRDRVIDAYKDILRMPI